MTNFIYFSPGKRKVTERIINLDYVSSVEYFETGSNDDACLKFSFASSAAVVVFHEDVPKIWECIKNQAKNVKSEVKRFTYTCSDGTIFLFNNKGERQVINDLNKKKEFLEKAVNKTKEQVSTMIEFYYWDWNPA